MEQTTVRVSTRTRDLLREMSRREGRSMQGVIERALEVYRRARFLEDLNADWGAVREEPAAWRTSKADRSRLDGALGDGLSEDEVWTEDGEAAPRGQARGLRGKKRR